MTSAPETRPVRRHLVLICIIFGLFMVAIEATVVATAMPSIVGRLGGFSLYSWVFTAFLLTQAATTVMFGKLADLYGRRPVLIGGIVVFLVGSLLCGCAWSMGSLIAFRLLQGLGAGSIQPVAMTIIGDHYSPEERGSIQGYLSSAWGISAVLGPMAGGFIVERFSWPWIFWMNIPIGIVTIIGLMAFLHEKVAHRKHDLDAAGAALFAVAISALLLALAEFGRGMAGLWVALPAAALFAVVTPLFLRVERRHAEPMLPLDLWTDKTIGAANIATFAAGMAFMGVTTYLPVYAQGVMGYSATWAGLSITMMSVGWPLASIASRRLFRRFGIDGTLRIAGGLLILSGLMLQVLRPDISLWWLGGSSFVLGGALGLMNTSCVVLIQSSVEWQRRGAATSSNVFSRTLGNMVGAAALGAAMVGALGVFADRSGASLADVRHLLDRSAATGGANLPLLRHVLDQGMHVTFAGLGLLALGAALMVWRIPVGDIKLSAAPTR